MRTFPILLNLRGRRVVVVGGGPVGLRRARALAEAQAEVTLVDPSAAPTDVAGVTVVRQPYRKEFLEGAFGVFACTDDRAVNRQIAADARSLGALVNAADQIEDCDFFLPAVWKDGDVVVAVGTGGTAPALAVYLRDRLAPALPPRIGEFARLIGELREALRQKVADRHRRSEIMTRLCSQEVLDAFLSEGPQAVHHKLTELVNGK
jgi:siroheme synthase-like protein